MTLIFTCRVGSAEIAALRDADGSLWLVDDWGRRFPTTDETSRREAGELAQQYAEWLENVVTH